MSNESITKSIIAFGKALRECNRCPVYAEEEIVSVKRITGKDGNERELIVVKKLATKPSEYGTVNPDRSTFRSKMGFTVRGTVQSISAELRKGHGIGRGIVTDGVCYRYVK